MGTERVTDVELPITPISSHQVRDRNELFSVMYLSLVLLAPTMGNVTHTALRSDSYQIFGGVVMLVLRVCLYTGKEIGCENLKAVDDDHAIWVVFSKHGHHTHRFSQSIPIRPLNQWLQFRVENTNDKLKHSAYSGLMNMKPVP